MRGLDYARIDCPCGGDRNCKTCLGSGKTLVPKGRAKAGPKPKKRQPKAAPPQPREEPSAHRTGRDDADPLDAKLLALLHDYLRQPGARGRLARAAGIAPSTLTRAKEGLPVNATVRAAIEKVLAPEGGTPS